MREGDEEVSCNGGATGGLRFEGGRRSGLEVVRKEGGMWSIWRDKQLPLSRAMTDLQETAKFQLKEKRKESIQSRGEGRGDRLTGGRGGRLSQVRHFHTEMRAGLDIVRCPRGSAELNRAVGWHGNNLPMC